MKPADKNWEYEEGKSILKPGEHAADPSKIPLGTEQELFPSEIASFHFTAKSTRDDIAINVVLVHVKAFVELPQGLTYCDGEINIPVHVKIQPEWLKEHTEKVELEFKSPKVCDNPAGMCSQLAKKDEKGLKWGIDNARWFSTRSDHCNNQSEYFIGSTAKVHGAHVIVQERKMFVSASGRCVNGYAEFINIYSGAFKRNHSVNKETGNHEIRISIGNFRRDTRAKLSTKPTLNTSQYYRMVYEEEYFHAKKQRENPSHWFWSRFFNANDLFNKIRAFEPFTGETKAKAEENLQKIIEIHMREEIKLVNEELSKARCDIEREAKNYAKSTHIASMPCTYPKCK